MRDHENVRHCVETAASRAFTRLRFVCDRYFNAYLAGMTARIAVHGSNMRTNPTQVQTTEHLRTTDALRLDAIGRAARCLRAMPAATSNEPRDGRGARYTSNQ